MSTGTDTVIQRAGAGSQFTGTGSADRRDRDLQLRRGFLPERRKLVTVLVRDPNTGDARCSIFPDVELAERFIRATIKVSGRQAFLAYWTLGEEPNLPEISLPWFGSPEDHPIEPKRSVTIWRDQVKADDLGEEIAEWLSAHLGCKARLVRIGNQYRWMVQKEKVPAVHQQALGIPEVSFTDAYPFLIISEASLADLNRRLEKPIPMNRFRPNIVIGGVLNSYAEDQWQSIEIGSLRFRHGPPCVRCVVTTTDQITLERGKEPLKTLATYRRNDDGGVNFGMNFFCESSTGTIQVGDVIRLLPNEMTNDK